VAKRWPGTPTIPSPTANSSPSALGRRSLADPLSPLRCPGLDPRADREMGAETDSYTYDAWGMRLLRRASFENPFRWVGKVGVLTGQCELALLRASANNKPAVGRWLSQEFVGIRILSV